MRLPRNSRSIGYYTTAATYLFTANNNNFLSAVRSFLLVDSYYYSTFSYRSFIATNRSSSSVSFPSLRRPKGLLLCHNNHLQPRITNCNYYYRSSIMSSINTIAGGSDNTSVNNGVSVENNRSDINSQSSINNAMAVVAEHKKQLRKQIRSALKAVTTADIQQQSLMVWNHLYTLEQFQNAKKVGLFLSMPSGEINTDDVLKFCTMNRNNQKTIYVPIVGQNFERSDMELIQVIMPEKEDEDVLFYHNWPRNKWNIPEPPDDMPKIMASPGDLDLIIVPGLGFDRYGNRLGQGKGYYDRFLARVMNTSKKPYLIGVGLDCQLVPSTQTIPTNEYDFPLDLVITPNQVIVPSSSTSS